MSNAIIFLFFLIQIAFVYAFYRIVNAIEAHANRIARLENQKPKPEPKAPDRVQARQIWDKEIEGFNPKAPKIVLPRNEEQKAKRVYTDWEIDSDFKIVG